MSNITIKSGLNNINVEVSEGTTVGAVLANPNFAAVLNYDPSNVEGILNGAGANEETILHSGDILLVQKKAHSKAAGIVVKSGLNSLNVEVADGSTVGSVLANPNYAAVLNFDPSNVEGILNGAGVSEDIILHAGDTLLVQKKAHSKAVLTA